jgi:hypothetical protein
MHIITNNAFHWHNFSWNLLKVQIPCNTYQRMLNLTLTTINTIHFNIYSSFALIPPHTHTWNYMSTEISICLLLFLLKRLLKQHWNIMMNFKTWNTPTPLILHWIFASSCSFLKGFMKLQSVCQRIWERVIWMRKIHFGKRKYDM